MCRRLLFTWYFGGKRSPFHYLDLPAWFLGSYNVLYNCYYKFQNYRWCFRFLHRWWLLELWTPKRVCSYISKLSHYRTNIVLNMPGAFLFASKSLISLFFFFVFFWEFLENSTNLHFIITSCCSSCWTLLKFGAHLSPSSLTQWRAQTV